MKQTSFEEQRLIKLLIDGLSRLSPESQHRVIRTGAAYCGGAEIPRLPTTVSSNRHSMPTVSREPEFQSRQDLSPKSFLLDKAPSTDVDRVACLAYYLTHYRNQSHFKTGDITKLNTEAAQLRFSNSAYSVENATKCGFLAPAGKGQKQISALGERYVDALPDRQAAKIAIERLRPRRFKRLTRDLRSTRRGH